MKLSIEQYLLKKRIAKNHAHAQLIMIGVIILCIIIIALVGFPRSSSTTNPPELTDEYLQELEELDGFDTEAYRRDQERNQYER